MSSYAVGIDLGSSSAKTAIFYNQKLHSYFIIPTGWNSHDAAVTIQQTLAKQGITDQNSIFFATGYGRISVPYAQKTITEITCHGKGAWYLKPEDAVVIDIGGQDTKIIEVQNNSIRNFMMNDKCSAGTGKFIEVMANSMGIKIETLFELAASGSAISISSMCTVFAESEIISHIGAGAPKEDLAAGIIDSVVRKVGQLAAKFNSNNYFLTGGFCQTGYLIAKLEESLGGSVSSDPLARYAGAIGAALLASEYTAA